MRYSALAGFVRSENPLEEEADFEEEVCNAGLVASARAVSRRIKVYAAAVAISVAVSVGVAERCDSFCFNLVIATCAMRTLGCSGFGAGCGGCVNVNDNVVAACGNNFCFGFIVAAFAVCACGYAGFGAGCFFCFGVNNDIVAERSNFARFGFNGTADFANLSG